MMMKTYLEPQELKLLEFSATNPRDRLLIRLLSHLGCRISEALAITAEDVDLQEHVVKIQHLKTRLKLACPHPYSDSLDRQYSNTALIMGFRKM